MDLTEVIDVRNQGGQKDIKNGTDMNDIKWMDGDIILEMGIKEKKAKFC